MELAQEVTQILKQYGAEKLNSKLSTLGFGGSTLSIGGPIQSGNNTSLHIMAPTINLHLKAPSDEETKDFWVQQLSASMPVDDRAKLLNAKARIPIIKEAFQFIMQSAEYLSWERESSGTQLLWVYGPPATGKTMFSLFLTQELDKKESKDTAVLYYFCNGLEFGHSSPTDALRGLMKFFIAKSDERARDYVPDVRLQGRALFGQLFALWRIFANMVNNCSYQTVYCVIDGLDECPESSMELLERFVDILMTNFERTKSKELRGIPTASITNTDIKIEHIRKPAFKLVVVSRDKPKCLKKFEVFTHIQISKNEGDQKALFQDTTHLESSGLRTHKERDSRVVAQSTIKSTILETDIPPLQQPRLSSTESHDPETSHAQDMTGLKPPSNALEFYICERIERLCKDKMWNEDIKQKLEERLGAYNDGTFLWVEAAVDLLSKLGQREAQRVLFTSETTKSMWCSILIDIPSDLKAPARFLLKWLSTVFVPLKLTQLEEVWCSCFSPGSRYSTGCHMIQEAFKACGILLERGADGDVNIKHQEVKNFLTQSPSVLGASKEIYPFFFAESDAHCEIAKVSVNYIEQSIFRHDDCDTEIDNETGQILCDDEDYTARHPFIQYSARFWPEHAKKATSGGIKFDSSFFTPGNIARRNWSRAAWGFACHIGSKHCPKFQTRLHIAAFFDLEEWAQYLCSQGEWIQKIEKRNSDLMTPLFVAAARESVKVFAVLLDHGAERTIMDENVFHFACRTGSRAIVSLLLKRNVDVNETTSAIGLLQCLTSAFRLLPGLSGIVNMRRSSDWKDVLFLQFFGEKTTPLHNAVLGGHEDIVEMLLRHQADVNQGTLQNGTAVHIAAWKGTPHMLELLKKYGADFTRRTSTRWYPIHCAAVHGNEATIQWLLSHGAFVDSTTADGETALHLAAQYGLEHTAKLLLDSKAVVDAKTVEGLTPLHIAAQSGYENVVLVLLMYNADQRTVTKNGKTALQLAEGASKNSAAQILRSAERVEKDSEGHMTSEENFGIPHIGVPQVTLPPFVLHAIESGLSTLGSRRTNPAPSHWKRYDEDDLEQPRHGKGHHHHHHVPDEEFDVESSREPGYETAPRKRREEHPRKRSSVHFDNEDTSKSA